MTPFSPNIFSTPRSADFANAGDANSDTAGVVGAGVGVAGVASLTGLGSSFFSVEAEDEDDAGEAGCGVDSTVC